MVVLDTSIIIDHLRRPPTDETLLRRLSARMPKEHIAMSVLSVQELYEGKSTRDQAKEASLLAVVTQYLLLPYSFDIAKHAGKLARELERPIEFPDAAIAATAIEQGAQLFTLNEKDFRDIPELTLYHLD